MPTDHWVKTPVILLKANDIIDAVLDERGDKTRERSFRMCATLCRHRAISQLELDSMPDAWHRAPPVDIAGGPVEILSSTPDMPNKESVKPCHEPTWEILWKAAGHSHGDDRLKLPIDCGKCPPCAARAAA